MGFLKIQKLQKRFGSVSAVRDLSLDIEQGQLVALVGPSGCGKTTLLRLIAGFETPDGGDILLNQTSTLGIRPEHRKIGLLFQDYALFPHMNIEKNIAYGLKFARDLTSKQQKERVEELINLFGLAGMRKRMPDQLSSGQQQRAALARTLAPQPQILLLDEPFSALDQRLRDELRLELKALQRQLKITTIHVTHDQEEALAIADKVAVMNHGRLEQFGSPWDVYQQPSSEFVAQFVGKGNLLKAQVLQTGAERIVARLSIGLDAIIDRDDDREFSPGDVVSVLLRPEKVSLDPNSKNQVEARLTAIEFLGDLISIQARVGDAVLHARVGSDAATLKRLDLGQTIRLGFSSKDCRII